MLLILTMFFLGAWHVLIRFWSHFVVVWHSFLHSVKISWIKKVFFPKSHLFCIVLFYVVFKISISVTIFSFSYFILVFSFNEKKYLYFITIYLFKTVFFFVTKNTCRCNGSNIKTRSVNVLVETIHTQCILLICTTYLMIYFSRFSLLRNQFSIQENWESIVLKWLEATQTQNIRKIFYKPHSPKKYFSEEILFIFTLLFRLWDTFRLSNKNFVACRSFELYSLLKDFMSQG